MAASSRPSAFAVLRLTTSSYFTGPAPRQVSRFLALEDAVDIDPNLAIGFGQIGSVARETTRFGIGTEIVHRRNSVPRRQCHQFFAPAEIERITCDQKRAGPCLGNGCKGRVKFVLAVRVHDVKLQPERASGLLHFVRLALGIGIGVIQE